MWRSRLPNQIRDFFSHQSAVMEKSLGHPTVKTCKTSLRGCKMSLIARANYWRRRKSKQALLLALFLITMMLYGNSKLYHGKSKRSLTERPTMHTFFDSNDVSDVEILGLWNDEWTRSGFTTKILLLEDMKGHPDFEDMMKTIETHWSGDETKSLYRWLAMSASDGGWFSSFDTLPTKYPFTDGKDLPHDGALTLFQGNIPSLVSGSVEEWDRVTKLLLGAIPRIEGKPITDIRALEVLRNEDNQGINFLYPPEDVHVGFVYDSPRQVNCGVMSKVKAINFTPKSVQDAVISNLYPVELSGDVLTGLPERKEAFSTFLNDWKSQCEPNIRAEDVSAENELQENKGMENEQREVIGTHAEHQENMAVENGRQETIEIGGDRPIMHTFFHPSPLDTNEIDVNNQLKLWKEEWGKIGFDTVILTLDDAKKNPNFEEFEAIMTPLYGNTGFEALCFYRWLAMASCGGGWLSDYDILPTNFPISEGSVLPIHGKFISYQSYVPSLMSADEQEWKRVSRLLIGAIPRIKDLPGDANLPVTDLYAFNVIKNEGKHGILFVPLTIGVQDGYIYREPNKVHCRKMSIGRAVHMSRAPIHKAIVDGVYPIEVVPDDPRGVKSRVEAKGAEIFMNDWRSQCTTVLSTPRPIMHTFFSSSLPTDDAVLQLWRETWTSAGFDPVVLTIDDARKHPNFEEVEREMTLLHDKIDHDTSYFYRWLAMAVSGGGWISDYETLPIAFPVEAGLKLPNEGKFTLFQNDIPLLMSGSEGEWDRVSKIITDVIPGIKVGFRNDLYAFNILKTEHNDGVIFNGDLLGKLILRGFAYIQGEQRKVDCAVIDQTIAVHMDNSAVHASKVDGSYPIEIREDDPNRSGDAEACRVFFADVQSQCGIKDS